MIEDIKSWGGTQWSNMNSMFASCTNLGTISATDAPDLNRGPALSSMFSNCDNFDGNLYNWNTAYVVYMDGMFSGATAFNQDIGAWNIINVISMSNMFSDSGMSTENYSKTLIGWANQVDANAAPYDVPLDAANITYSNTAYTGSPYDDGANARGFLTGATANWTITDGGLV